MGKRALECIDPIVGEVSPTRMPHWPPSRRLGALVLGLCLLFGSPRVAWGTTILKTDLREMIAKTELVFEGRVISLEARADSGGRLIHTYVVFEVVELIKGSWLESTIELRFLGGTVGDRTLSVAGMRLPEQGEHGIYFVESPGRIQVNPFFGWAQGHFLVLRDDAGRARVWTQDRRAVVSTDPDASTRPGEFSRGTAAGIVAEDAAPDHTAITATEFKRTLRTLLKSVR